MNDKKCEMDDVDRHLLDLMQTDFPLVHRPYALLGERVGISEAEAFARVRAMQDKKIIRRIGANFNASRLGRVTTLCAAHVPEDKFDLFVDMVNGLPEVTHNYVRDHTYNVWFTLISSSHAQETVTLAYLRRETGVTILNLPATRLYKVQVDFAMRHQNCSTDGNADTQ
jgi:DNA-binding Lrp family transcriptional regulator